MNNYQDELIGMFIIKPELLKMTVLNGLYFDNDHRAIFERIKNDYDLHHSVTLEDLIGKKDIDFDLAIRCATQVTTTAHFEQYQDYAIRQYKKRYFLNQARKLNASEIDCDEFFQKISGVAGLGVNTGTRLTLDRLMKSVKNSQSKIKFTRFTNLAKKLNLKENDLVILAGKTGAGKSALALNLADDLSCTYPCLYFNLEMSESDLNHRLISINSKITTNDIDSYINLPQTMIKKINDAASSIANRQIDVINHSVTLNGLRSAIMTYPQDKHFIVFIDHIGLIGVSVKSSYERMTEIAKEIRKISIDNNCTIIALCQLSRTSNNVNKPSLDLLRDSGEIEQSASKVMFIWEENEDHSIVIEKNRSGKKAMIPITYNKSIQLINELTDKKDIRR